MDQDQTLFHMQEAKVLEVLRKIAEDNEYVDALLLFVLFCWQL